MSRTEDVTIRRSPRQVFATLCDPTTYPDWLVGAQTITQVDDGWPAVGSKFHHRIGWGPFRIPGSTSVTQLEADRVLQLSAGMGLLGEARVTFRLDDLGGSTAVSVEESPRRGIVGIIGRVARPIVEFALWGRNEASLAMLRQLVEHS